jgi:hypothetical protein
MKRVLKGNFRSSILHSCYAKTEITQICVTSPQCVKIYLQEVGCGGMDWTELAQDRNRWWAHVNVAMNLQVP